MVLEGDNVIAISRKMIGATSTAKADIGTIRGDYSGVGSKNIIHGSDSVESAKREINLWFASSEVYDPVDHHESWIYENVLPNRVKSAVVETVQIDTTSAPKS
jgi:nucleoside-diphosphate kinase